MHTSIEELGPCKKKLIIEVTKEEIKGEVEKEFIKIKDTVSVPGFRKGRVPRRLLEKRFGDYVKEEVKQNVISNSYQKAIEENKLMPLGSPEFGEIDFDLEKSLNFSVTLEVKPSFEIKDYRGLRINKKALKVSDEMVEEELKRLSMQKAQLKAVEGGEVTKGDVIICDCKVEVEGKTVWHEDNIEVYPSNQSVNNINVPDLEKSLLGLKSDEEVSINISLDDNFTISEYVGRDAVIMIKVKDIKRPIAPIVDDNFAKQLDFDSLDDLKKRVRTGLEFQLREKVNQDMYNQITDKLLSMIDFVLPKGVVDSMTDVRVEKYKTMLLKKGAPLDKVEEIAGKLKDESEERVVKELKLTFILEQIAENERIYVTDNEIDKRIAEYARNYNITPETMRRQIEKMENMRSLRHQMREEKTLDFLFKEAEIIEDKP